LPVSKTAPAAVFLNPAHNTDATKFAHPEHKTCEGATTDGTRSTPS
jgi:hypothetical protein